MTERPGYTPTWQEKIFQVKFMCACSRLRSQKWNIQLRKKIKMHSTYGYTPTGTLKYWYIHNNKLSYHARSIIFSTHTYIEFENPISLCWHLVQVSPYDLHHPKEHISFKYYQLPKYNASSSFDIFAKNISTQFYYHFIYSDIFLLQRLKFISGNTII